MKLEGSALTVARSRSASPENPWGAGTAPVFRARRFGSPSPRTRAPVPSVVRARQECLHLEAQVMHAAVRVFLQEFGDRRFVAERMQKLDLGVRQLDERHRDAVFRQRRRRGHLAPRLSLYSRLAFSRSGTAMATWLSFPIMIGSRSRRRIAREVVKSSFERSPHRLSPTFRLPTADCRLPFHTSTTSTCTVGFLPQTSLMAERTARSTAPATESGSRRFPRGRLSNVSKIAASISASTPAPSRVARGSPAE